LASVLYLRADDLRRWENQQIEGEDVIILYHCAAARSFRPLWTLEELGLPYDLRMLPFPPRVLAREYLALNPLGTFPCCSTVIPA
jgi:hypothetical protein